MSLPASAGWLTRNLDAADDRDPIERVRRFAGDGDLQRLVSVVRSDRRGPSGASVILRGADVIVSTSVVLFAPSRLAMPS